MERHWIKVADDDGFLFGVRDDGTLELSARFTPEKARAAFEKQYPLQSRLRVTSADNGPAIQGHVIAVIRSIREESESERLQSDLEPIDSIPYFHEPEHGGES